MLDEALSLRQGLIGLIVRATVVHVELDRDFRSWHLGTSHASLRVGRIDRRCTRKLHEGCVIASQRCIPERTEWTLAVREKAHHDLLLADGGSRISGSRLSGSRISGSRLSIAATARGGNDPDGDDEESGT